MPRRLKVLMSAYACEPNRGSEPEVGWQWALQMARFHDVTVVTRANNREPIERALPVDPPLRPKFIYYDLPPLLRFWKRGLRGINAYYYLWQLGVDRLARRLHAETGFDLAHHVTFAKYWQPSRLVSLPVPFIFGPVGGGESSPPALASTFSWRGRWYERARNLARSLADFDPLLRDMMRRARVVMASTEDSKKKIERLGAPRVVVEPQLGIDDEQLDFFARFPTRTGRLFRLISIGRLLHWKGFHLGLEAFARVNRLCPDSEYWVVGGGPEAANLERLAAKLGVAGRVRFWGFLPHGDVYDKLAQADVLVHPAIHEAFGNVCLEAMAAGRPVICLDAGGPSVQVTEECGFRAPVASVEQALQTMTDAIALLCREPDLRLRLGLAARERARTHFRWAQKAERINALYEVVCGPC